MKYRFLVFLLAFALIPAFAAAQCTPLPIDPFLSYLDWVDPGEHQGNYPLSVMIVPDGSGDPLELAFPTFGGVVDGRIGVTVINAAGMPSADVPPAVIRLAPADDRLVFCPEFDIARRSTDAEGWTYFDGPFGGGGQNQTSVKVRVCNVETGGPGLPLWMNSPDINGDLVVNLQDVQLFSVDFFGTYDYRSDLAYDGVLNLSDLGRLAQHYGTACP